MKKKKGPCEGCVYWKTANGGTGSDIQYCGYILVTGHCRPCPPGPGCTARKERRKRA